MDKEKSLDSLGIEWKSQPNGWIYIPKKALPYSTVKADVKSVKGEHLFHLHPLQPLGKGQFGQVDKFEKQFPDGRKKVVALKTPLNESVNLLYEALFQWSLHQELKRFHMESVIPEVYDIFVSRPSGVIYYTMEYFQPQLLSNWCAKHFKTNPNLFPQILLQIAYILDIFEYELLIDHRDLKVNNILVLDEPVIFQKGTPQEIQFPFRVIIIDFGYSCIHKMLDIRDLDPELGIVSPIDFCPKEGRDIFQVLVSLWSREDIRQFIGAIWGGWIRERIHSADEKSKNYVKLTETERELKWMYWETDDKEFQAPMCSPKQIISDCLKMLVK
jgi:serine/threonine protein kinase